MCFYNWYVRSYYFASIVYRRSREIADMARMFYNDQSKILKLSAFNFWRIQGICVFLHTGALSLQLRESGTFTKETTSFHSDHFVYMHNLTFVTLKSVQQQTRRESACFVEECIFLIDYHFPCAFYLRARV